MPLFVDNDDLTIVFREHEFNAEALDGRLTLIPDDAPSYIIAHHPNKTWTYDIGVVDQKTAAAGYEDVIKLGIKRGDGPKLYYALILVSEYVAYRKKHNFRENLLRPIEVVDKELITLEEYQSLYAAANEEGVVSSSMPASVSLDIPAISVVDYEDTETEGSTTINPEITINAPDTAPQVTVNPEIKVDVPEISPQVTVNPEVVVEVPKIDIPTPQVTVNIPDIIIPEPTVVNLEKQSPLLEKEEAQKFTKLPREYIGGSPKSAFSETSIIRN